jgi:hypothetical protein
MIYFVIKNKYNNKMTLKQLRKKIKDGDYSIKNKEDSNEIKKYYFDIDEDNRKIISKKYVKDWDSKKSKLADDESLRILSDYLDVHDKEYLVKKIKIAGQYDFKYIECKEDNIRQENIFKMNFLNIVEKLNEYFPNVKILIEFEASTTVDTFLKKPNCTYKHDVLIKIQPNKDYVDSDETFEVVLEYFEEIHNKFNDDDKKIATNLFSDAYMVFNEKEDDMKKFIKKSIYTIMELICACQDKGKYELSKILYFNETYQSKNNDILLDVELFNKIIDVNKNDKFNLEDLYNQLQPVDPDTGDDLNFNEFTDYIDNNYNKRNNNFELNNPDNNYSSDVFGKLILFLNYNLSNRILKYKQLYMMAIDKLFVASDRIREIMREQRKKRLQLPDFVKNIKKFHINNLRD